MAINEYTPEQKKAIDHFMPYVEQASRKVTDAPNGPFHFSAFVWSNDFDNPVVIHVGNVAHKGDDFIQLHYELSWVAAMIEATGSVERSEVKAAPNTQTPEEIADKLAVTLLAGYSEGMPDEARALLDQYLQSRKK